MGDVVDLDSRRKPKPPAPPPVRIPPTVDEIRGVLRQVTDTLQDTGIHLRQIEEAILHLEQITDRHSKYLLSIVQALLRAGVDVPLTTKPPPTGPTT